MTDPDPRSPAPPLTDAQLDALLAQARALGAADQGAAERFLRGAAWKQVQAASPARPGGREWGGRGGWLAAAVAAAALLAGVLVLRPTPALPASAAYDAYQHALGDGW